MRNGRLSGVKGENRAAPEIGHMTVAVTDRGMRAVRATGPASSVVAEALLVQTAETAEEPAAGMRRR